MFKKERQFLEYVERHLPEICFVGLLLLSFAIRVSNRHFVSKDAARFLLPWFEEIKAGGGLSALSVQVGDYNALYQFLIALMTYLPFSALTMYKALSIVFDYVLAAGAAVLVLRLSGYGRSRRSGDEGEAWKRRRVFITAFSAVLYLPTVIFNSSLWAQCDSIYTSFILWSLAALIDERDRTSFVLLGLAFSWKLQTVFILPFYLIVWFYRRRFTILYFLYIPLMMVVTTLPAVLAGRPFFDTFLVYLNQTETYPVMTARFPNLWMLIGGDYGDLKTGALLAAVAALGALVLLLQNRRELLHEAEGLILTAALSVWIILLILPGMHDRYAYLLDLLLVIPALTRPRKYGLIAAGAVLESTLSYSGYLFGTTYSMPAAALLWLLLFALFVKAAAQKEESTPKSRVSA